MSKDTFVRKDGEIKEGDWFKSKWRTENKFFHYVHVEFVLENGYQCSDSSSIYPKDDVLYRAEKIISENTSIARSYAAWSWGKIIPTEITEIEKFFDRYLEEVGNKKFNITNK